jgi:hypothetical protein
VDDVVDDADNAVEEDENNDVDDAKNDVDDAVRGHGDELRDGPPKAALTAAIKSCRNVVFDEDKTRDGPSAGLASVGT